MGRQKDAGRSSSTPSLIFSPRSLFSLCSLLLLLSTNRPMKMTAIPTSTQEIVTIIFKPSPSVDLWSLTLGALTRGAIVPVEEQARRSHLLEGLRRTQQRSRRCRLTSIIAERGKLDPLLRIAGAVVNLHLQFVPGGLLQLVQDVAFGEGGALGGSPGQRVHGSILQGEGCDGTAAVVPAAEVELDPGGVDAGEELLLFGELRFCRRRQKVCDSDLLQTKSRL